MSKHRNATPLIVREHQETEEKGQRISLIVGSYCTVILPNENGYAPTRTHP